MNSRVVCTSPTRVRCSRRKCDSWVMAKTNTRSKNNSTNVTRLCSPSPRARSRLSDAASSFMRKAMAGSAQRPGDVDLHVEAQRTSFDGRRLGSQRGAPHGARLRSHHANVLADGEHLTDVGAGPHGVKLGAAQR